VRRLSLRTGAFLMVGMASIFCSSCFAHSLNNNEVAFVAPADRAVPDAAPVATRPGQPATPQGKSDSSNRFAVGVDISTLGVGGEVAHRLTHRLNLRGGFNIMNFSHTFTDNGVTYAGQLHFRSAEAYLDWFFLGPLHLSPGVLLYNGNGAKATASVAGGQTFTLNGTTYQSSTVSPIGGSATLGFNKVAPAILFGVGNMIPRNGRHFSGHFEIGGIYEGSPNLALAFTGSACTPPTGSCTATNQPVAAADVTAQQNKFNHDAAPYKFYPIVSAGFSVAF
jgi:hypothetical protein